MAKVYSGVWRAGSDPCCLWVDANRQTPADTNAGVGTGGGDLGPPVTPARRAMPRS